MLLEDIYRIDFASRLNEEEQTVLVARLETVLAICLKRMDPGDVLIQGKQIFSISWQGEKHSVYLRHDILCRQRYSTKNPNKKVSDFRYEVISNNLLGKGGCGSIFPIVATLSLKNDKVEIKKYKQRVVKRELCAENDCYSRPERESSFGMQLPYLHMKPAVSSGQSNYIVMYKLLGKSLAELLVDGSIAGLENVKRLTLMLALLQALKEQIHDREWVHRDIAPRNIMVNFKPENSIPEVQIIDFGFCKKITEEDRGPAGTRVYRAPEAQYGESCQASDVFSMGIVFLECWRTIQGQFLAMAELIGGMLECKVNQRISLQAAIAKVNEVLVCYKVGLEEKSAAEWQQLTRNEDASLKVQQQLWLLCILLNNWRFTPILREANFPRSTLNLLYSKLMQGEIIHDEEIKNIQNRILRGLDNFTDSQGGKPLQNLLQDCFNSLKEEQATKSKLTAFRQVLRGAVINYIQETYTFRNIKNKDRAISERRMANIRELLTILNQHNTVEELQKEILQWKKTIQRGLLGRSALWSGVEKVMDVVGETRLSRAAPCSFWQTNRPVVVNSEDSLWMCPST
jgi:serine/threonine protein kinase